MVAPEVREAVTRECQRIEEDTLHSAKGHFAAASGWGWVHLLLGLPTAVLAAVAGVEALSQNGTVAGVIAIVVAGVTAATTFLNPNERAGLHRDAANRYLSLRNRTRILREIDVPVTTEDDELRASVKALGAERDDLNQQSPQIPGWGRWFALRGIERGEASYAVDSARQGGA